ncbi:MAG: 50S ribosomal protein L10 [Candidatus Altiarchaeota archaeon]
MVAEWKKGFTKDLKKEISSSKVVGLVRITGIPSKQLQVMRKKLTGNANLRIVKNNLLKRALEQANIKNLGEHVDGPTGIVFSELDPFRLEKLLQEGKTRAKAKPGSIAPSDIIIPKGDTPFPPGPIIGELQTVGVKARIQGGKIVITEDSKVASEGDVISQELANVLGRLGLEPFEIGLKLNAAYDGELIYAGDVLRIDAEGTLTKLRQAYGSSLSLALNANIFNSLTMPYFIREASANAKALAYNAEILTEETVGYFMAKANAQAAKISAMIPETAPEPEKKDEGPQEST